MNSCLAVISSSEFSWLLICAIVFSLVSVAANALVFWGLWIEGKPTKEPFRDISEFRKHNVNESRGWKILMLGIFLEIVATAALAGFAIVTEFKTANEIAKNNPLNQPVMSVSASVMFTVRGDLPEKKFSQMETDAVGMIRSLFIFRKNDPKYVIHLVADKEVRGSNGSTTEYFIEFHKSPLSLLGSDGSLWNSESMTVRQLDELEHLEIVALFLPDDSEILGGKVSVFANPGNNITEKKYTIRAQSGIHFGKNIIADADSGKLK